MVETKLKRKDRYADENSRNGRQVPNDSRLVWVPKITGRQRSLKRQRNHSRIKRSCQRQRRSDQRKRRSHQWAERSVGRVDDPVERMHSEMVEPEIIVSSHWGEDDRNWRGVGENEQIYQRPRRQKQATVIDKQAKNADQNIKQNIDHSTSEGNIRSDAETQEQDTEPLPEREGEGRSNKGVQGDPGEVGYDFEIDADRDGSAVIVDCID